MLDVGWPELLVIGAVALVVVGPKDLPKVMHTLGRMAGKMRAMAHDLNVCIEQVGVEAELAEKRHQQQRAKQDQNRETPPLPAEPEPPPELEEEDAPPDKSGRCE